MYQGLGADLAAVEPPFWVAVLAAYLRQQGKSVAIIDANAAPGADVIAFDLGEQPGAVSVITWTSLAARGRRCPRSPIL